MSIKVYSHSARRVRQELFISVKDLHTHRESCNYVEAKKLAFSISKKATSFGLYDIAVTAYDYLCDYYNTISPDSAKYKIYSEKLSLHEKLRNDLREIREFYNLNIKALDRNRNLTQELKEEASYHVRRANKMIADAKHGPYFFQKYYYLLCLERSIHLDYEGTILVADEALEYFRTTFLRFTIGEFYFNCHKAEAYYSLQDIDKCEEILRSLQMSNVPREAQWNFYTLLKGKLLLLQRIDISTLQGEWISSTAEHNTQMLRLLVYNELIQGRPIGDSQWREKYKGINSLRNDPSGLGISLYVAKCLSARLSGNHADYVDSAKMFKWRHGVDERSRIMIDYIVFEKEPLGLDAHPFNPEVEIIPYEKLTEFIPKHV